MEDSVDIYFEPGRTARAEIRERGSRFIAELSRVRSAEAAAAMLAAVKKREHAATHHCSAWRLGVEGSSFRFDDDGEPSGTAGMPIFKQIEGRGLTNVLIVVIRYFGGTKLGTGGLARAYGAAASAVLDESGSVKRVITVPLRIQFAYDDTSPTMQVLSLFNAEITQSEYAERTTLVVRLPRSRVDAFQVALRDALAGRGIVERMTAS